MEDEGFLTVDNDRLLLRAVLPDGRSTRDLARVIPIILDDSAWVRLDSELYLSPAAGAGDVQLVAMRRPSGVLLISRDRDRAEHELVSLGQESCDGFEVREDYQGGVRTFWPRRWFVPVAVAVAVLHDFLIDPLSLPDHARWVLLDYGELKQEEF